MLADSAATANTYCLIEQLLPAGQTTPPHLHAQTDEVFYVLDGDVEFFLDDRVETASRNSLTFIPRGTVHAHRVVSETARLLNLHGPAGFERVTAVLGQRTDARSLPPAGWTPPKVSAGELALLLTEVDTRFLAVRNPFMARNDSEPFPV